MSKNNFTWKPQVSPGAIWHANVRQGLRLVNHGIPEEIGVRPDHEAISVVATTGIAANVNNPCFPLGEV